MDNPGDMAKDMVVGATSELGSRAAEGIASKLLGGAAKNLEGQLSRAHTANRAAKVAGRLAKAEGKTAQQAAAAGSAVGTAMEAGQRAIDKKNQKPRDQHD